PATKRDSDGHAQSSGSLPTLTNNPCTIAAASPATTAATATASSEPTRGVKPDSPRRDRHSSTDPASPSHSAYPLTDRKRATDQPGEPSGTSATTTTTSSARPSIAASRGSRHRSGSHGS